MGDKVTDHEMIQPKWSSDLSADTADPLLSAASPDYSKTPALSDSCSPLLTTCALRERERETDLGVVYPTFLPYDYSHRISGDFYLSLIKIEFNSRLRSYNPDFVSSPAVQYFIYIYRCIYIYIGSICTFSRTRRLLREIRVLSPAGNQSSRALWWILAN